MLIVLLALILVVVGVVLCMTRRGDSRWIGVALIVVGVIVFMLRGSLNGGTDARALAVLVLAKLP